MDIRTVAKRAAVSTATVSRTVNRTSTVTPALARRVWKAVRELGYSWRPVALAFEDAIAWFREQGLL